MKNRDHEIRSTCNHQSHRLRFRPAALAVLLSLLGPAMVRAQSAASGRWAQTGSLNVARQLHTATLLDDGTVLVVGGCCSIESQTTAELYNPGREVFFRFSRTVYPRRAGFTATKLVDGRVLIAGGWFDPTAVEIYDPATKTFEAAGGLKFPHYHHTATLLDDGTVLLAGGIDPASLQAHPWAEVYDPWIGRTIALSKLNQHRYRHAAARLPDGRILIAGGQVPFFGDAVGLDSAEIFDPASRRFSSTGRMAYPVHVPEAVQLDDAWQQILIVGRADQAQLYRPDASLGRFYRTGDLAEPRTSLSATLLESGEVLVAGGADWYRNEDLASCEYYGRSSGGFGRTADLSLPRQSHAAVRLQDGRVLVSGGYSKKIGTTVRSAEIFSY